VPRLPLSLVVPLFNEQERLAESAAALVSFVAGFGSGSELLFVDDGSADRTAELAERLTAGAPIPVHVIRGPHRGKGAAVQAGLERASAPVAAFCDVDLATPLDELERIVTVAEKGPAIAIGSRDVVSTQLVERENELREFLGKTYNRLLRLTLTPGIADTQCGAKAATAAVWQQILPYCRELGFAWDAEVVAVARRRGIAVWEVGVRWAHDGRTRVRTIRDGAAMVRSVPRIRRRLADVPSMVDGPVRSVIDLSDLQRALAVEGPVRIIG